VLLRRALIHAVLMMAVASAWASSLWPQSDLPEDDVMQETLRFTRIFTAIQSNYMDALDSEQVIYNGGIRGGLSALDPFSSFFDPDQFEQLRQFTVGKSRGFGSILYVQTGKVLVLQTAEGSPSHRAGLGPGDEIVSLNGTRMDRLDFQSLIELLQRSRSQKVRLGVVRPGKFVSEDFDLYPAEIPNPSVDKSYLLQPGTAYLHVSSFDIKTPQEVAEAVEKLGGSDLKGLLLDLRDNRGGVVDAAVGLASVFLKPDLLVLTQRGRSMAEKSLRTFAVPLSFDTPMIVLINGTTASSAEVFVAALQEHDRAVVAGEPSFGKGVVESVVPLSARTGLALTTAQYFTPSGRSIQRRLPGTALADPDSSLRAGADPKFHTDNGRPLAAGGGILPDVALESIVRDPWVSFLNERGIFTIFASEYLTLHGKIDPKFEPDAETLEAFKSYLDRQRIRTPGEYWAPDAEYLKHRIKVELFNLVLGLTAGDEVDVRGDPQVQQCLKLLPKIPTLLLPPAPRPVIKRPKPVNPVSNRSPR